MINKKPSRSRCSLGDDDGSRTASARAFFGRRKGHALRPRQAELIETALLPRLALDLTSLRPPICGLIRGAGDEVRWRSVSAAARHLIAQATAIRAADSSAVERLRQRHGKALVAIETASSRNIRLHLGDASELIAWLPDASWRAST